MTFGFSPQPSEEIHIAPLESYEQFKLPSDHSLSYVNANLRVILQQLASVLGNELEHGTNLFVQGTAKWLLQLVHLWYFQSESPKWLIRNKERSIQFRGWDWLAIVSEMHNSHLMLEVVIRSLVNIFFLVSQKAKLYFVRAFRTRNKQQADYKVIHQVIVSITTNFDQLAESALYPHWTKNPLFMLLWAIEDDMRSLHLTSPTQAIHIVDFFGIKLNEGLAQKKRNLIRLATLGLFIMLDPAMLGFEWIWDLVIASNTSQYRTIIGTALLLNGNIISRENIVNFRTIFFEEIRALEEIGCADQLMRTLTFSDNLLLQH